MTTKLISRRTWILRFSIVLICLTGFFILGNWGRTKPRQHELFLNVDTDFLARLNDQLRQEARTKDQPLLACDAFAREFDFEEPGLLVVSTTATRLTPVDNTGRFTSIVAVDFMPSGVIYYDCEVAYLRELDAWRLIRFDLVNSPRLSEAEAARLEEEFWKDHPRTKFELTGVYLAGRLGIPSAICGAIHQPPAPGQLESGWGFFAVDNATNDAVVVTKQRPGACRTGVLRTFQHPGKVKGPS